MDFKGKANDDSAMSVIADRSKRFYEGRERTIADACDGYIMKVDNPMPSLPKDYSVKPADVKQKDLDEFKRQIMLYREKPLKFFKNELGLPTDIWRDDRPPVWWDNDMYKKMPLWSKQREIIYAMVEHKKVAVKSCHASGKTFLAGGIAIYLAMVWFALGITTAPTGRQVKDLLWQEIAYLYNGANQWQWQNGRPGLGGRLLTTKLDLGDKWFVEGFSTDSKEANIPGFHEENVFAIVDEAGGCDNNTFDLLETILTSQNSWVLLIGQPLDKRSRFRDCFQPGSGYYCITITDKDVPNVKHKRIIWPKLLKPSWPDEMRKKFGKASPFVQSRVDAEFPDDTTEGLIPFAAIEAALQRDLPEDEVKTLGGDIARLGGDRIIVVRRHESGKCRLDINEERKRLNHTTGRIVALQKSYARHLKDSEGNEIIKYPIANIDDIGVGGGVTDFILEQNLPCNGINVAESADADEMEIDGMGRVKFQNKRAYYCWKLRQAFIDGVIDINDEELAEEATYFSIVWGSKGVMGIIEKDKIKRGFVKQDGTKVKGLGRSPDKFEALMLAWAEDSYTDDVLSMISFL